MILISIPRSTYRFLIMVVVMGGIKQAVDAIDSPPTSTSAVKPLNPLIIQAPDNNCGYLEGKQGKEVVASVQMPHGLQIMG